MAVRDDKVEVDDHLTNNGSGAVRHTTDGTWGDRESYGPSGFRGLFANYYVSLCAAFAAVSISLIQYFLISVETRILGMFHNDTQCKHFS